MKPGEHKTVQARSLEYAEAIGRAARAPLNFALYNNEGGIYSKIWMQRIIHHTYQL